MGKTRRQGHQFHRAVVSILTRWADRSDLLLAPCECEELASEVISALEYVFREGLGGTPLQFMKRGRLNRANRFRRLAPPNSTTVSAR